MVYGVFAQILSSARRNRAATQQDEETALCFGHEKTRKASRHAGSKRVITYRILCFRTLKKQQSNSEKFHINIKVSTNNLFFVPAQVARYFCMPSQLYDSSWVKLSLPQLHINEFYETPICLPSHVSLDCSSIPRCCTAAFSPGLPCRKPVQINGLGHSSSRSDFRHHLCTAR